MKKMVCLLVSMLVFALNGCAEDSGSDSNSNHDTASSIDAASVILESDIDDSMMAWSASTNFMVGNLHSQASPSRLSPIEVTMRCGINVSNRTIVYSLKSQAMLHPAYRAIENISTNEPWCFQPLPNERFAIELEDSNGNLVKKTKLGQLLGSPVSLRPDTLYTHAYSHGNRYKNFDGLPKMVSMKEFDISKIFVLERPGLYKLTMSQRLYVVSTNFYLKTIYLPPATVAVRVEN